MRKVVDRARGGRPDTGGRDKAFIDYFVMLVNLTSPIASSGDPYTSISNNINSREQEFEDYFDFVFIFLPDFAKSRSNNMRISYAKLLLTAREVLSPNQADAFFTQYSSFFPDINGLSFDKLVSFVLSPGDEVFTKAPVWNALTRMILPITKDQTATPTTKSDSPPILPLNEAEKYLRFKLGLPLDATDEDVVARGFGKDYKTMVAQAANVLDEDRGAREVWIKTRSSASSGASRADQVLSIKQVLNITGLNEVDLTNLDHNSRRSILGNTLPPVRVSPNFWIGEKKERKVQFRGQNLTITEGNIRQSNLPSSPKIFVSLVVFDEGRQSILVPGLLVNQDLGDLVSRMDPVIIGNETERASLKYHGLRLVEREGEAREWAEVTRVVRLNLAYQAPILAEDNFFEGNQTSLRSLSDLRNLKRVTIASSDVLDVLDKEVQSELRRMANRVIDEMLPEGETLHNRQAVLSFLLFLLTFRNPYPFKEENMLLDGGYGFYFDSLKPGELAIFFRNSGDFEAIGITAQNMTGQTGVFLKLSQKLSSKMMPAMEETVALAQQYYKRRFVYEIEKQRIAFSILANAHNSEELQRAAEIFRKLNVMVAVRMDYAYQTDDWWTMANLQDAFNHRRQDDPVNAQLMVEAYKRLNTAMPFSNYPPALGMGFDIFWQDILDLVNSDEVQSLENHAQFQLAFDFATELFAAEDLNAVSRELRKFNQQNINQDWNALTSKIVSVADPVLRDALRNFTGTISQIVQQDPTKALNMYFKLGGFIDFGLEFTLYVSSPAGDFNNKLLPGYLAKWSVNDKSNKSPLDISSRAGSAPTTTQNELTKGGIDFDPTNMNLQIKRNGKGAPLPLPQQNLEEINIPGLFPVIINITPITAENLPIFLGQIPKEPAKEAELTAQAS